MTERFQPGGVTHALVSGLVAEAREGWSPPDWYRDAKAAGPA
jgi:hypothetical protein